MSLKTEIETTAQHLAKRFMESGQSLSLSKLVAEVALERNYNAEQIKRLIEETNRAVFYELFNSKQDKNVEFPIAKFEEVLQEIRAVAEPAPTTTPSVPLTEFDVDDSDFDIDELYAREGLNELYHDLPRNELEKVKQEMDAAKEREDDKVLRITVTYVKAAAEEVKQAAMREEEFRSQLRELLVQASKLGLTLAEIDEALRQVLGTNYTQDIRQIISEEYARVQSQMPAQVKVAAKGKDEVGLTKHELEFLESLRDLSADNLKKIVNLRDKVDPERLKKVVANTYGPTSMRMKLVEKVLQESKEALKGTVTDLLKSVVNQTPELSTAPMAKTGSWRGLQWRQLVEQERDVFLGLREALQKKAAAVADYVALREQLIMTAKTEQQRKYAARYLDPAAELVVNRWLQEKQAQQTVQTQEQPGKFTKFMNKLTDVANTATPLLNVATGAVGLAASIRQLQALDMDIKAKKQQLAAMRQGYYPKYASVIASAIRSDLNKLAATAVVPMATQVASKTAPVLRKIYEGLKAASNFMNNNAMFINMGVGLIQNQINNAIQEKQEQLERLNKLGSFNWDLLINSMNAVRSGQSFFAHRPYSLNDLKKALKERNPDWEDEVISKTVNMLASYAPAVLEDPYLTEEVVRRVRTYGGVDPNYLIQLQQLTEHTQNVRANKLTSI